MSKIEINNVYKIFGPKPHDVLEMVKSGSGKEEVLEKTGHTVGLDNVSLKIEEGETFVCMGLSGSGKSTLIRHLNRLIDPTDGEILVEGTNVMSLDTEKLIDFRRHKMSMLILCLLKSISFSVSKLITFVPSTNISPSVGSINLLRCLIRVDFPDPDNPIQTNVSPSSIFNETLSNPTVWPVFSNTSSLPDPLLTISKTSWGFGPKIL